MLIHASCAARDASGVLLTGPPGSGKSDLLFRLIDRGFRLVADDQVEVTGGWAKAAPSLEGLLEVRGIGIIHFPDAAPVKLVLSVDLGRPERLPLPKRDALGLPLVVIDPMLASAAQQVELALDCVLGRTASHVGAFAP